MARRSTTHLPLLTVAIVTSLLFTRLDARQDDIPTVINIPAGHFIIGSDRAEREIGYLLDEAAYEHDITRKQRWYETEQARRTQHLDAFWITRSPITNAQYVRFVEATGHRAPHVDAKTWHSYGLIHPYARAERHMWRAGRPPQGRLEHPVVLVARSDALAYAAWLSRRTGHRWMLPSESQWEKAARGTDGRRYPWGDAFDATVLNSHDRGPFDTTPVGAFAGGHSPFGLVDAAGQVFEWTRTPSTTERTIVKGGSWDDKGCGICRPAARHARPNRLRHILIGFRLVRE